MGASPAHRAQSPLNMILPMKSWLDFMQLRALIDIKERVMVDARDTLSNLHFARFVDFRDHNLLGYFTVFDGDFRNYFGDFIQYVGPIFDSLFKHVVDGPPVPCERNREAFLDWSSAHHQESIGFYSAYPTLTAKEIIAEGGVNFGGVDRGDQSPLTLVLPIKSSTHFEALSQSLARFLPGLYAALDIIGTVHFFRFVPLGTNALAIIGEHDGDIVKLAEDFLMHLGPMFDQILQNVVDSPPAPVRENRRAFTDWIVAHNLKTWGLYSAYPFLSVKEIRVLASRKHVTT